MSKRKQTALGLCNSADIIARNVFSGLFV